MSVYVYWNGTVLGLEDVNISPLDRGYQFGDGVYEVIRFYHGTLFETKRHMLRLERSLNALSIPIPTFLLQDDRLKIDHLEQIMYDLIERENLTQQDGIVYLQITRGTYPRSHGFPKEATQPNMLMYVQAYPRPELIQRGAKVMLHPDLRWSRVDIKTVNLLGNVLAKQKAEEKGYHEAILHRSDIITEATAANVFIVRNGIVWTHPANEFILNGVTRSVVIDLIHQLAIPFVERPFNIDALLTADEVFLTSTTLEVTPVVMVDERTWDISRLDALTPRLQKAFEAYMADKTVSNPIR